MGVGQAMHERTVFDDSGQLLTAISWITPCRARITFRRSLQGRRVKVPSTTNPLGVKGAGEAGTTAASRR